MGTRLAWSVVCLAAIANLAGAGETAPVRLASGVRGHIHPSLCITKNGTLVVIFGQSDMQDLRVTRSTDGGRTWTKPTAFGPSIDQQIYPGSLTTLADGRVVHFWNRWLPERKEPRYIVYSVSTDDGATWGAEHDLPKSEKYPRVIRHPFVELAADRWLISCADAALVHNPQTGATETFTDGRSDSQDMRRAVVPIVRTPRGTLVSGFGLRSTDDGKTWQPIKGMPDIATQGWRHDLACLPNGWLLASEVLGPGTGGDKFRYVVSHDDGLSWSQYVDFLEPGREIGGRACPRAVQVDPETVGIVYYDAASDQAGGPGLYFLRMPLAMFGPTK